MLAFLPWLRLRNEVRVGRFRLFPHTPGQPFPPDIATAVEPNTLNLVLSQYRTQPHLVARDLCVLQFDSRRLGDDLNEGERAEVFQFGRHLAVAGMAGRRFLGEFPDRYTATGHYQVVIQGFANPYSGYLVLEHRRKGGYSRVLLGQKDVHFVLPAHLMSQGEPEIDRQFLNALESGIPGLPASTREHLYASITQFLLANSDSPDVPPEVEAVATYSAFEQLADQDSIGKVRERLLELLSAADRAATAPRLLKELPAFDPDRPAITKWINHLYRLRGCLAHGKTADGCRSDWLQFEHLVAGALVYPLALKCLLSGHRLYALSSEDVAHILGLENLLADRPFFATLPAAKGGDADETEQSVAVPPESKMRWLRQWDAINRALLGIDLSAMVRRPMSAIEARGESEPSKRPT